MNDDSVGQKPLLVSCFIAGVVIGLDSYGVIYGIVVGIGFALGALMFSEFLGELISKPVARYAFVIIAAFATFQVLNEPKVHTRGGGDVCADADRFGQEKCLK